MSYEPGAHSGGQPDRRGPYLLAPKRVPRFHQPGQRRHRVTPEPLKDDRSLLTHLRPWSKKLSGPPIDRLPLIQRAFLTAINGHGSCQQANPHYRRPYKETAPQVGSPSGPRHSFPAAGNRGEADRARLRPCLSNFKAEARKPVSTRRLLLTAPVRN